MYKVHISLNVKRIKQQKMNFLQELKKYRIEAGLTQEQLAEKSGISRVTIANIERGILSFIKSSTVIKLADALKVDSQFLLCPS